jgi:hypothetical protein
VPGQTGGADSSRVSVSVSLDGKQLRLEPGQAVIAHGPDRNLSVAELQKRT